MVPYKCNTCDKSFDRISDYNNHLNRKNPCVPRLCTDILFTCHDCNKSFDTKYNLTRHLTRAGHKRLHNDKNEIDKNTLHNQSIDQHTLQLLLNLINNNNLCNNPQNIPKECYNKNNVLFDQSIVTKIDNNCPNILSKNKEIYDKTLDDIVIDMDIKSSEKLECIFCYGYFANKYSLTNHIESCEAKKKIEQEDSNIKHLIEQIDNMNKKLIEIDACINPKSNNIKNTNIKNTSINNNNGTLCAFGEEDLSCISNNKFIDIINKGYDSIKYIIEYIHFNKNKPEYHNIYVPSLREKHVNIFDGQNWMVADKKISIEKLIDNIVLFLKEKYEELKDSLPYSIKNKFTKIIELNQKQVQRTYMIKELQNIMYYKKSIVILIKDKSI